MYIVNCVCFKMNKRSKINVNSPVDLWTICSECGKSMKLGRYVTKVIPITFSLRPNSQIQNGGCGRHFKMAAIFLFWKKLEITVEKYYIDKFWWNLVHSLHIIITSILLLHTLEYWKRSLMVAFISLILVFEIFPLPIIPVFAALDLLE